VLAGVQVARRPIDAPSVPPVDFLTIGEWPPRTVQFERYKGRREPSLNENREPHQLIEPLLLDVWTYEAPRLMIFAAVICLPEAARRGFAILGRNEFYAAVPQSGIPLCRLIGAAERMLRFRPSGGPEWVFGLAVLQVEHPACSAFARQ
jgi:hypothetical protein